MDVGDEYARAVEAHVLERMPTHYTDYTEDEETDADKAYSSALGKKHERLEAEARLHNLLAANPQLLKQLNSCVQQHLETVGSFQGIVFPPYFEVRLEDGRLGVHSGHLVMAPRHRVDPFERHIAEALDELAVVPVHVPYTSKLALLDALTNDKVEWSPMLSIHCAWPCSAPTRLLWLAHDLAARRGPPRESANLFFSAQGPTEWTDFLLIKAASIRKRIRWKRTVLVVLRFKRWAIETYDEVRHRPKHIHKDEAAIAADMASAMGAEAAAHNSAAEAAEAHDDKRPRVE